MTYLPLKKLNFLNIPRAFHFVRIYIIIMIVI